MGTSGFALETSGDFPVGPGRDDCCAGSPSVRCLSLGIGLEGKADRWRGIRGFEGQICPQHEHSFAEKPPKWIVEAKRVSEDSPQPSTSRLSSGSANQLQPFFHLSTESFELGENGGLLNPSQHKITPNCFHAFVRYQQLMEFSFRSDRHPQFRASRDVLCRLS